MQTEYAAPEAAPKPEAAPLDAESELKRVLAELRAERTASHDAMPDPRIVVPEALASMVGLPAIKSGAFKKVR